MQREMCATNVAKDMLYEKIGGLNLLINAAERRTTENRSEMMATYFDIIDYLFKLEENNIKIICCASNWKCLPKINPKEITNISLADKVAQMEAKFLQYELAITDVKLLNSKMDVSIMKIENTDKINAGKQPTIISSNWNNQKVVSSDPTPSPTPDHIPASGDPTMSDLTSVVDINPDHNNV